VARLLLLAGVALGAAGAWWTGLYHASPEAVRELVSQAGVWGPVAFVALFVGGELVHFPGGVLFMLAAAALWPARVAIPTAYAAALVASLVVFGIARWLVPAELHERVPERLRRYETLLESHGLVTVIGLRLVLFMLPTVHWLLGASRVSARDFALGTALGLLPGVLGLTLLGGNAFAHWAALQPWLLGGLAVAGVIAVARGLSSARRSP
jgi:uncharacterized membrane protein YdjX (TVP38/TMEM64 family)